MAFRILGWLLRNWKKLADMHEHMAHVRSHRSVDGIYITWETLKASPSGVDVPHANGGRFRPEGGFNANPVTWCTLSIHPVAVRGPSQPSVFHDDSLFRQAIVWGVLGITRLHAALRTGDIISKTHAGDYALGVFSHQWASITREAMEGRTGSPIRGQLDPFRRRREALAFMEVVLTDALRSARDDIAHLRNRETT